MNYTNFDDYLREKLKDKSFRKEWNESETEYLVVRELIKSRLEKNMSQRELAKKAGTTQAVLSRVENMNANPSIKFLQKLAKALDKKLVIEFR